MKIKQAKQLTTQMLEACSERQATRVLLDMRGLEGTATILGRVGILQGPE